MELIHVGLLFGGTSEEHEISLRSAKNIWDSIDANRFKVIPIAIDKAGQWFLDASLQSADGLVQLENLNKDNLVQCSKNGILKIKNNEVVKIDIVFPMLHGPFGEDGKVQSLLETANLPYIGSGVLSSALCMDKDLTKKALLKAGLPTCKHLIFTSEQSVSFENASSQLGDVLFVKPANMGSSVGVHKVKNETEYIKAINDALKYDTKIIIEESIKGREIECGLLGTKNTKASSISEIFPGESFYTYDDKYSSNSSSKFQIPADLSAEQEKEIKRISIAAFKVLDCKSLARCDFFIRESDGAILINEINSLPGCTSISMFPKMWEAAGVSTTEWISLVIDEVLQK